MCFFYKVSFMRKPFGKLQGVMAKVEDRRLNFSLASMIYLLWWNLQWWNLSSELAVLHCRCYGGVLL